MAAAVDRTVVEQLRERIRQLEAGPREWVASLRTGLPELDGLLPDGGLPLGSAVELCGEPASGRTSLALRAIAAGHREGRLAAWVDGPGQLYAPAAQAQGVDLSRLLRVRPAEPEQLIWSAVQLARSGAFTCVVLDTEGAGLRPRAADTKRLADAAFRGGCLLLWLTTPAHPGEGMLRVSLASTREGLVAEVLRSRRGGMGARARIPWGRLTPVLGEVAAGQGVVAPPVPASPVVLSPATALPGRPHRGGHGRGFGRPGRDRPLPSLGQMLCEPALESAGRVAGPLGSGVG